MRRGWSGFFPAMLALALTPVARYSQAQPCIDPAGESVVTTQQGPYGVHMSWPYLVWRAAADTRILCRNLRTGATFVASPEDGLYKGSCYVSAELEVVYWGQRTGDGRPSVWAARIVGGNSVGPAVAVVPEEPATVSMGPVHAAGPWLVYTKGDLSGGTGSGYDLHGCRIGLDAGGNPTVVEAFVVDDGPGEQWAGTIGGNLLVYLTSPAQWEWQGDRNWDLMLFDLETRAPGVPLVADPAKDETMVAFDGRTLLYQEAVAYMSSDPVPILLHDLATGATTPVGVVPNSGGYGPPASYYRGRVLLVDAAAGGLPYVVNASTGERCLVSSTSCDVAMLSGPAVVYGGGGTLLANVLRPALSLPPRSRLDCRVVVPVYLTTSEWIHAFSIPFTFDPTIGVLVRVEQGSLFETIGAPATWDVSLDAASCDPLAHGGWVASLLSNDGSRSVPPGSWEVARLVFERTACAPGNRSGAATLQFRDDCFGSPATSLVVVTDAGDVTPDAVGGDLASGSSCFTRGDADSSGRITIGDVVRIVFYLFRDGELCCLDAADADDDGEGPDMVDAMYIITYLFRGGPLPPAPFGEPGADPTPDGLGCDA